MAKNNNAIKGQGVLLVLLAIFCFPAFLVIIAGFFQFILLILAIAFVIYVVYLYDQNRLQKEKNKDL